MSNTITPNVVSKCNNQVSFGNNTQTTIKTNNSKGDSFVSKHKKEIIVGSAIAGVAALITTAIAWTRGKTVNIANGNESKLFSNISEGFKSFFGKGKEAYKAIINKNSTQSIDLSSVSTNKSDKLNLSTSTGQNDSTKTYKIARKTETGYSRKYKADGKSITEFYEGDKLTKTVASQAYPDGKYVKVQTSYPDGCHEVEYFKMGAKKSELHSGHVDSVFMTDDTLEHTMNIASITRKPVQQPKYGCVIHHDSNYHEFSTNSIEEIQEMVETKGLPYHIEDIEAITPMDKIAQAKAQGKPLDIKLA